MENEKTGVQNTVDDLNKIYIAVEPGTRLISRIIPYLEMREVTARKYLSAHGMQEHQDECLKQIVQINIQIATILGL